MCSLLAFRFVSTRVLLGCSLAGIVFAGEQSTPSAPNAGKADPDPMKTGGISGFPIRNPIDSYVLAKLNEAKIKPSRTCSDEEFIRRAYLDVIGVIPTADAVKAFLADRNSQKRERLVDQLLSSERYGAHWAVLWGDLLREHSQTRAEEGSYPGTYREWLRQALNSNLSYDQFATQLITSKGRADQNGAVNFYLRDANNRIETANTLSSAFLGTRMACAQCHDHPFDQWEQKDFHSLLAFFQPRTAITMDANATLVRLKDAKNIPEEVKAKIQPYLEQAEKAMQEAPAAAPAPKDPPSGKKGGGQGSPGMGGAYGNLIKKMEQDVEAALGKDLAERLRQIVYQNRVCNVAENARGDYRMPSEGDGQVRGKGNEVVEPVFPWDKGKKASAQGSRREALAQFVVEAPQFAKVHVNRIWAALTGRGIVDPVDDFRPKNPPSHPELLDFLAEELVKSKFNTRHVLKLILTSSTYERSSLAETSNRTDKTLFSHRLLRRMSAEQLFDSILVATGQAEVSPLPAGVLAAPAVKAAGQGMGAGRSGEGAMAMLASSNNTKGRWAIDQATPASQGSFMHSFNQPNREEFCASRDKSVTITQALELFNGRPINESVKMDKNHFVQKLLANKTVGAQLVAELYLATLSRLPSSWEISTAGSHIGAGNKSKVEDLHWALMNTREFMFIK